MCPLGKSPLQAAWDIQDIIAVSMDGRHAELNQSASVQPGECLCTLASKSSLSLVSFCQNSTMPLYLTSC